MPWASCRTPGMRPWTHSTPREQDALNAEITELEKAVTGYEQSRKSAEKFIALIDKYENFDTLTNTMLNEFVEKRSLSMNAPAKAARTPRRRLKSTSILWAGISPPALQPVPLTPEGTGRTAEEGGTRRTGITRTTCAAKANGKQKEWERTLQRPSARPRWRRQRLQSGPRTWKKAFLSLPVSYPGRSRARPPYRPAPQFNHHSAKEDEHERIDLHPLRRLLHPRP